MEPFRIDVPQAELDALQTRLGLYRRPPVASHDGWRAGVDLGELDRLVALWRNGFDWRASERALNGFPQFTVEIDGATVHFVHVRALRASSAAAPIPIYLGHGWPYSFVEMLRIVPYLVDPVAHGGSADDAFDVVIPSLPGYGFSSPLNGEHFTSRAVAEQWHTLMTRELGYDRYATYGEDVSAWISDWGAALHPESVVGLFATHAAFPADERKSDLTEEERRFEEWLAQKWQRESAYASLQSTKPDTLAAALNDSPAGLAAWLLEKFCTWSGDADAFRAAWSDEQILTTVSLYWFTQTIGTSFLPYYDGNHEESVPMIDVPVGVAVQRGERGFPRSYAERTYRDVREWQELPSGGHFTAAQSPDLVAEAMRRFFRPLRSAIPA